MLYGFDSLRCRPDEDETSMQVRIAAALEVTAAAIADLRVVRESIDARKKPKIILVRQVEFRLDTEPKAFPKELRVLERSRLDIPDPEFLARKVGKSSSKPVVVVGAGPAGLFAALALGESGIPTILLERGKPVDIRMRDIGQLRSHGLLDPESNVCFGEGGAGAYTDGKLYTRVKHPHVRWVMRRLVDFEASPRILVDAHPHLGTDKLVRIVRRMRQHIEGKGVEVRFQARVERVVVNQGRVRALELNGGETIPTEHVVLAIGHSARDTLAQLQADGIQLEAKPFAVGVRVEHPQAIVNRNQYGKAERDPLLGAAAYSLTYQHPDEDLGQRGVYTFCMCPGGFIVPSPTEPDHMAINGMSNANRSTPYANAGVVVQVTRDDLLQRGYADSPLIGIQFQRDLERSVFSQAGHPYHAVGMRIADFVQRRPGSDLADTHFRPGVKHLDLNELLPDWIAGPLRAGMRHFERKIKGFTSATSNMLAVESRTSSPIRIPRGDDLMSVSAAGLYPVGEGAGYAGGIVSAAVDGLRAAEAIVEKMTS